MPCCCVSVCPSFVRLSVYLCVDDRRAFRSFSSKCYTLIHHKFNVSVCRCKHILQLHICTWQAQLSFCGGGRNTFAVIKSVWQWLIYVHSNTDLLVQANTMQGQLNFFCRSKNTRLFCSDIINFAATKTASRFVSCNTCSKFAAGKGTCSVKLSLISP